MGSQVLMMWLALIFAIACLSGITATDHIVGANRGWNPGINYTLWSNNQTFYVGDLISFRYQKNQYNVFEVNQTGYDNCTTEGATGNWSSGKDFILLNESKRYYFICGNGQCFNGMKVSVLVHPLTSPPQSSAANHSSPNAAATLTIAPMASMMGGYFWSLAIIISYYAFVWFGCGWI